MASLKNEINKFLSAYFNDIQLKSPLFFKSKYSLRFDLQYGKVGTEQYFNEAVLRAKELFQGCFDENDSVICYLIDFKWKRRKLRFSNYCFKNIADLTKDEVSFHTLKKLYSDNGSPGQGNLALAKIIRNRINHEDIFRAIANKDFSRQPSLDQYGFLGSKEIYFINLDRRIIFHMYDDRGLDIIASDREAIKPLYSKYSDWILESNRNEIDESFNN
jgi:hypothetical protein